MYSIVITTFDRRFESHFIPLINDIYSQATPPPREVIVMINGPHASGFDQNYRKQILDFLSGYDNAYPTMFPNFQSLAKLWNRGILAAQSDKVLVLNDDLRFKPEFFQHLKSELNSRAGTFKINGSFSHYVIHKPDLIDVGFFDERLLGIGEEDGDFAWRFFKKYGREIPSVDIPYVENIQSDIADPGFKKGIRTASRFNREFILNVKYKKSIFGHRSMFDYKVVQQLDDLRQYPYEQFYRENVKNL